MNNFGRLFSVQIFGESHGFGVGIIVDGCPAGVSLSEDDFLIDLERRNPNIEGTTERKEADLVNIKSGIFNGLTTGAPILLEFTNKDIKSEDYYKIKDLARPGHSDFTAYYKFGGFNDFRGGGHFSGRLTAGLVAAGTIAKKIISPVEINAKLEKAGGSFEIEEAVKKAKEEGDSIGGIILCTAKKMPIGLGEPFFDSVESMISHIVFAIPAVKGVEFGAGFKSSEMKGSEHNDSIISEEGKTQTNNAGGVNGGISNGNELIFRVAIKPASSISKNQSTINLKTGNAENIKITGRHDACIAIRAPVVVEAAAAIALADLYLINKAYII